MQTTKSPGGYLLIEYEPADVEDLNDSLGMSFFPHGGAVLYDPNGTTVWRHFGPEAPTERPSLLLSWELRRLAVQEGS